MDISQLPTSSNRVRHGSERPLKPPLNSKTHLHFSSAYGLHTFSITLEGELSVLEQAVKLPSQEDLISLLDRCRKEKNLAIARRAHACIRNHGLEADGFLGNYMVPMYVDCGSVSDAQEVFDRLAYRNEYSWTSLIHGYTSFGNPLLAFSMYPRMLLQHVCPSRYTFLGLLKACAALGDPRRHLEIHREIVKMGFEDDQFIGNALIDLYGKCGALSEAQVTFDMLAFHDVISWSSLIAAYTDCNLDEIALEIFEEMQNEGTFPNAVTYVSSLKACIHLGAIDDKGHELHAGLVKEGLDMNIFVGNTLIDLYAKGGCLEDARDVFDEIQVKDIVSWNTLISGYAEKGWEDEVVKLLKCMHLEGLAPDATTYVCSLKACGGLQARDVGKQLHMDIVKKHFDINPYVGSALVDMYMNCKSLPEAEDVFAKLSVQRLIDWNALLAGFAKYGTLEGTMDCFHKMPNRDVVSWNTILAAHANHGLLEDALSCLISMQSEGVQPCVISWNSLMLGYVEYHVCETPFKLYLQMQEQGVCPDEVTFAGIMKACGNRASLDIGKRAHSCCRSLKSSQSTVVLDMYARCGNMFDAQKVFDAMPERDIVGWSTLIAGYARQGKIRNVFLLLEKLKGEGVQLDGVAFLHVLMVCSHAGLVEMGAKYFEHFTRVSSTPLTRIHYNCMIDLFGRAGQLDVAMALLQIMPFYVEPSTWRTMLGACDKWANVDIGTEAFARAVKVDEDCPEFYMSMANIYVRLEED